MWKYIAPRTKLAKATGAHAVLLKLLDDFISQNETEPIRVLVRTWKDQALVLTYQQIRTWIDSGDVTQADLEAWRGDYMKALSEKLKPVWMKAASAPVVPDNPNFKWISDSEWEYSPQKGGMDRWLRDHTAKLVTRINDQQQQALKEVIAYGKIQKMGADELSKYLRPLVGLNGPQAMANAKYYMTIKAKLADEHPRMKPENIEKKARHMAQMYGEKQHRDRAKMIAQTELVNIYNSGSHYAIMQAISDGYIDAVTKTWVTARSDRVCAGCAALEGVTIPVDDYFAFRGTRVLYPTAHPRCKCVVEYNIMPIDGNDSERRLPISDETFDTWNNGSKDVIKPKNIRNDLNKSEVGQETLAFLKESGIKVRLCYNVDDPSPRYGFYLQGDDIYIHCDRTKTVKETAKTVIHEAWHAHIGSMRNTKKEEIECFEREAMHELRTRKLPDDVKDGIVKLVNNLYARLPEE